LPFWNVVYDALVRVPDRDATNVCIRRSPVARMSHQVRNPSTPSAWSRSAGTVCPPGVPAARSIDTLARQANGAIEPSAVNVSGAQWKLARASLFSPVHRSLPYRYAVPVAVGTVATNDGWPPHEFGLTVVAADHGPSGLAAVRYRVGVPVQYAQVGPSRW
jgi:hypothetical protein